MNEAPKVIINSTPFPLQGATDEEKASLEFGLQVGRAIQYEWFKREGNSCRYYDQVGMFRRRRLYARGEQPVNQYKSIMAVDGDLSYLNLNWDIVKVVPKFADMMINKIGERQHKVRAEAMDAVSAERKNLFQDMIEADKNAKEFLLKTKQEFGIDIFNVDPNELPETDEETELYMQIKYKPSIEIAEEIAIDTVMNMSDFKLIEEQIDRDQVELGVSWCKHEFNPGIGVELSYVDPENIVHSYSEKPDFSDCYYFGEIKQSHYTEVLKINPNISNEMLEEIRNSGSAWYDNFPITRRFYDDAFLSDVVTLIYFNYKSDRNYVYKNKKLANGGERIRRRDESFNPEENENFERIDFKREVWYEGVMVAGTNIILKWGLMKNMVRPKSASEKAMPNYIGYAPRMYKGNIDSPVERMIPHADMIQLINLKIQQVLSRITPDGVFIDADGLNEVDLGQGGAYNPEDALKLYFQTGSVIGRSMTTDGEFNNARIPIQELTSSSGNQKLQALIGAYNYELNMIRDVTGFNEATDGSTPHKDALVGVQKLAALNSSTAVRHVLKAKLMQIRRLATAISVRISDILEYAEFKDQFAMQVGKYNLAILEDIKNLYLHDFGIFIDLAPDEEEKQQLEQNIQIALSRDQIDLEDAIDIRTINNIKLANEMLKLKRKRKMRALQQREDMQAQMQAEINAQSQQMAIDAKTQQINLEANAKMAIKQNEIALSIELLRAEAELKRQLMAEEFNYNMQLKGIETDGLMKREDNREKAKDKRVDLQATRQSELIEQRQRMLPAKNFESSGNDVLGEGFDLESFAVK